MHMFYQPYPHEYQWTKDYPLEQVIREPSRPVLTRNQLSTDGHMFMYALTVSTLEPKNVNEAMTDHAWIESMQEKLFQFKRIDVWVLVPPLDNIKPLVLKWLFKNKHDEENTVIRNKTRLVVRGYYQEEGIDFEESFSPALYGLKQAPKAWYDELLTFLLHNIFFKGTIDPTLFIRRFDDDILVAKPTEKHLKEDKRIFRYLRGTINMGLWYMKDFMFELTEFSDVDYVVCKDTFKSTSGGAQLLGEKLEHVEKGMIELYFVKTDYQVADLFTKALSVDRFNYLVHRLDMHSLSHQELDRLAKS
nr:Gag-Pol polyprotein [Tanacetum cinerariifolium]